MAKARVRHDTNACTMIFEGNPAKPEPQTGVIMFPGGTVEVTRTTDNQYWAHIEIHETAAIHSSRVDFKLSKYKQLAGIIPDIANDSHISHFAVKIGREKEVVKV